MITAMGAPVAGSVRTPPDAPAGGARHEAAEPAGQAPARILVAMVDPGRRRTIDALLEEAGHVVESVGDGQAALDALASRPFDVMVLDMCVPRVSALNVLRALPSLHTRVEVLTVTADPCIEATVEAMKLGARDLMCCPCDGDYLVLAVERAILEGRARRELASVRSDPDRRRAFGLVGESASMHHVLTLVEQVAPTRATVLITGETGTGKELVARAVHLASDRRDRPFVVVNCSAIPQTLLESELFGHTRGSFTGAIQSRKGLIEEAHGGTLFLDEIGTISLETQVKLLRVIEERRLQRVGSNTTTTVDFRLVSATNEDIGAMVREGRFREDLYFRLNVFPIQVAPLRERKDDIVRLATHFLARYAREYDREPPALTARVLSRMMDHPWPGNVRELENVIERAVVMGSMEALSWELGQGYADPMGADTLTRAVDERWTLDRLEREYVLAVLERNQWKRAAAADELGVNRRTIHRKLSRYREEGLLPEHRS
jgi:DNA-binding NtrC family response regulator